MVNDAPIFFSRDEYARRLAAVRGIMREHGAQLLLVDEAAHLFYLAGFDPSASTYQACLVSLDQNPIMLLRELEAPNFREQTWLQDYVTHADSEDPVDVLAKTVSQRGWAKGRIGVELGSHYLTARRLETIRRSLPNATFVDFDFSEALWELRLRKSSEEISHLREAARIADAAMQAALAAVGTGNSERAAAIAAYRTFLELGGDDGPIGRIVSGQRSGSLKANIRNHVLTTGDLVHIELWSTFHGYMARLMRPAVVGSPSTELRKVAEKLVEVQESQFAAMKPGAVAKDVDRICRDGVLKAGLREDYRNFTGYTLGYYAPFGPRENDFTRTFLPTSEWILEPGMVFHMYTSARGIAFSETVLVTDTGNERLTHDVERKLFIR